MQNETQEYYGVRNNSCHSFTIETYNGGETWIVSATGNEHREAWKAEAELENEMINRGYQVFYSLTEAEDFIREMDRDTEGGLNLPQAEETTEEDATTDPDLQEIYSLTFWGHVHHGLGDADKMDVLLHAIQYGEEWGGIEFLTRYGISQCDGNHIVIDEEKYSELVRLCRIVQDAYDNDGSDLLQETSEQRIERYREQLSQPCNETPEEKELLDTIERLKLSPGERVYYDGTNYSFRKRSWQDVCLASHYEDNMPCRVVDLGHWDRQNALDAIRSLHERL